jgi:DNA-directed RNA polymerase subunit RPC12/RpoP
MEKTITPKGTFEKEDGKIRLMYARVVCPNIIQNQRNFIKCPECGTKILITPSLRKMTEAIENHVQLHKERESKLLEKHTKPINIRLALAKQVLYKI